MNWILGIDVGGTFTDCALVDSDGGRFHVAKELSTPGDLSVGILHAARKAVTQAGVELREVRTILHATTTAANTIIQKRGARVGLVTTRGFRDVIFMGRQVRHSTYDIIDLERHPALVAREHVYELSERMSAQGAVHAPVSDDEVEAIADRMRADGIESVAIGLVNAYRNPVHEDAVAARLVALLPDLPISTAASINREIGEYERLSTCVANAYVRPAFARYVRRLVAQLAELGFAGDLYMMQSNGGLAEPRRLEEVPVSAVEAGPAAGVVAARSFARVSGFEDLLTFDMGGTTAKACLVDGGTIPVRTELEVDTQQMRPGTGLALRTPSVDVLEIGAGGGSIATADLGIVRTGPESAGADPGPACYGRGGRRATVTDANVVLGYLGADALAGSGLELDADAAAEALRRDIAEPLGLSNTEAAWAVHEAVTLDMEHALRAVSIDRGRDPRRYALVSFGGAAPTHAGRLARRLGIGSVVIPPSAGVASACGLLESDRRFDVARSVRVPVDDASWPQLEQLLGELEDACRHLLGSASSADVRREAVAEVRYVGQGHHIDVRLDGVGDMGALRRRFVQRYEELYGAAVAGDALELAGIRYGMSQAMDVRLTEAMTAGAEPVAPTDGSNKRSIYFPELGGFTECPVMLREEVPALGHVTGPAAVQDHECTLLLLPGDRCVADGTGNLVVRVATRRDEHATPGEMPHGEPPPEEAPWIR